VQLFAAIHLHDLFLMYEACPARCRFRQTASSVGRSITAVVFLRRGREDFLFVVSCRYAQATFESVEASGHLPFRLENCTFARTQELFDG
jgi:hypothetical protein